ncbi:MAG: hypothetical protein U0228_00005 [Myxococcaceae bacterium]
MAARKNATPPPTRTHQVYAAPAMPPWDEQTRALHTAVLEAPDDLKRRSVFADALVAQGDLRGEYIHLAMQPSRDAVAEARFELLRQHVSGAWAKDFIVDPSQRPVLSLSLGYQNGLPWNFNLRARQLPTLAWLTKRAPIQALWTSEYEAPTNYLEQLAAQPVCAHLRRFTLRQEARTEGDRPSERLVPFLRSGAVRRLTHLSIEGHIDDALARTLAEAPCCATLTSLTLVASSSFPIGERILEEVASLPLTDLALHNVTLTRSGATALAKSRSLRSLALRASGGDGLAELAPLGPQLESFTFAKSEGADATSLANAVGSMTSLRALDLSDSGLGGEALKLVLDAAPATLRTLNLSGLRLAEAGTRALTGSPLVRQLESLDCSSASVAITLLAAAPFERLHTLDVGNSRFGPDGARALASGFPALRDLSMIMNPVGAEGAKALASAPWLPQLEALHVFENKLGSTGFRAMAQRLSRVRELWLGRSNGLKGEPLHAAMRGEFPALRWLSVTDVEPELVTAFVLSGFGDDLTGFKVAHSTIPLACAEALVTLPNVGTASANWSDVPTDALAVLRDRWPTLET